MKEMIEVFRMTELSVGVRISLIKRLGDMVNYQYASNVSEPLVEELISILNSQKLDDL